MGTAAELGVTSDVSVSAVLTVDPASEGSVVSSSEVASSRLSSSSTANLDLTERLDAPPAVALLGFRLGALCLEFASETADRAEGFPLLMVEIELFPRFEREAGIPPG